MYLPTRDVIASGLVAAAAVLYLGWLFGATVPGLRDARVTGLVVLVLGIAASASAVVPGFGRLLRGSRTYLAGTTLLGLAALWGGLAAVLAASGTGLTVLVVTMVVLWAVATARHVTLAPAAPPEPAGRHGAGTRERRSGRRSYR